MSEKSIEEMREELLSIINNIPAQEEDEDLFGFDLSGIQTGKSLLSAEEKKNLIERIQSEQLNKETARRVLAAVSGALRLALIIF